MKQTAKTIFSKESMNSPPQEGGSLRGSSYSKRKLDRLVDRTNQILLKTSTVFPFDFFPDDVTIDENKVNVVCREFFFSEDIHSILIKTIKDVEVQTSLLFATLKIVPDGYPGKPVVIKYLKKPDALCARRIILGLMAIREEKGDVDLSEISQQRVRKKVEELGTAKQAE